MKNFPWLTCQNTQTKHFSCTSSDIECTHPCLWGPHRKATESAENIAAKSEVFHASLVVLAAEIFLRPTVLRHFDQAIE